VQIEMQSKPIVLLGVGPGPADAYSWARQVADRYTEIKAVVFVPGGAPAAPYMTPPRPHGQ